MPEPGQDETEQEFVSRCIPIVLDDGTAKDNEQASAICYSMWRDRNKSVDPDALVYMGGAVKALGNGRVGGYLVRFTNPDEPDLDGEYFDDKTWYGDVANSPVYYNHGLDTKLKRRVLGSGSLELQDAGVWIEAQLEMRDQYEKAIYALAEQGKLGWSSGTAPHLVEREEGPKAAHILRWPLGLDASLTPTPADPGNRAMPLKAWAKSIDAKTLLEAGLDESPASSVTIKADTVHVTINQTPVEGATTMEGKNMANESDPTPQAPPVDVEAIVKGAVDAALKNYQDKLAAEPPIKSAGLKIEDQADRALKGNPWKSLGEMALAAVKAARMPHQVDDRLLPLKDADGFAVPESLLKPTKVATGLGEGLGAIGGFLVGTDRGGALPERTWGVGSILSRITMGTISANSNGMTYYATNETSRVTGARHGGVQTYWVTEGTPKTPSQPSFRQIQLQLHKAVALVYVTDELLADASALTGYLSSIYNDELVFTVEHAIVSGTGAGQPLGILASPALVTQAIEVGQLNTTFVAENAIRMWSRRYAGVNDYVWLINQDVTPQLYMMELPAGGGGQLVFMPPGGLSGSMYGTLLGRPIIEVEYASTLGTLGDVILCSLSQYQGIQKGGVESASSIHFVFDHDETVFRFVYRFDGQPTWNSPVTPHSGSANTVSPFVVLAGRP